ATQRDLDRQLGRVAASCSAFGFGRKIPGYYSGGNRPARGGHFSDTLEKELGKTSIPFVSASPEAAVNILIVRGEFTKIDEGNRSKRVMIGFGRGATDVQAHVTVLLDNGSSAPVVLSKFKLNSASGKKPGAAATMGVGSAGRR